MPSPPTGADATVHLGVDVGTSLAKAAAFDAAGELLAVASRSVPLLHPAPGWVEQEPELIIALTEQVLAEVCASTGVNAPALVAVTGQGDGCWLTDSQGAPVRAGISWMDGRAAEVLRDWERDGVCAAIFADNGNMMFPGAAAPILAWLDRHEPEALDRAHTAGYVKDLVVQRFTGLRATEVTDASLPFGALDGPAGGPDYSPTVLNLTGLTHRSRLLPPVHRPLPVTAVSDPGAAGLAPGTTMAAGPYDIPACAIGSGVSTPGDGLLIAGTTLACAVLTDRPRGGPEAGMTITMPQPQRWLRVMAAMVGTAGLDWVVQSLGVGFDGLNELIDSAPPGSNGVQVLPYLAPSGERAPFVDPAARAQFSGISLTTSKADLVRGLCEGLAYAARSCFEAAGLTGTVHVCGGGSRSPAWMRIFASVLDRPVRIARPGEVGARGAVLAAAEAVGIRLDAARWTGPQQVVDPDPAAAEVYRAGYQRFCALLDAARPLWRS